MAFLEWRRFNFFDIIYDADRGTTNKVLEDVRVTATGSGHGLLVLGDSDGNVHLITRNFTFKTFQAYNINVNLIEMSRNLAFLVTIGSDEPGINPLIKIWDVDKEDKHGNPTCLRILRASLPSRAVQATCLCLNESLSLMAVGFVDGSVALYRGNLPRERKTKQKILQENQQSVTGISFQETSKSTYLFVVTLNTVDFYNITQKDRETKTRLDNIGCSPKCSLLLDYVSMDHFMICRDDAVYCYTTDGRGPCYAIDGQKIMVQAFKSYIVIIAKDSNVKKTQNSSAATPAIGNEQKDKKKDHLTLTVLDIQNKFIVFSVPLKEVEAVLAEWGSFYVLTGSNSMCQLAEKDLQSKLALLLKKNLFDVSIRIAKNHHYDEDALVEIFLQYGDHLYYKGDHNGAIEQYMKTIGKLEPSYVIRKLVASHQIDKLTTYLQALHKQGMATADHTALLLNCYTKLNQIDKLKEFIMKDRDVIFDVEVALNVCRQTSTVDALLLAEKHRLHSWYLKIQIEDNHQLADALNYLGKLDFNEAVENTIRYGSILMEKSPKETTQFLKRLCTSYRPNEELNQVPTGGLYDHDYDRAPPEDFIHLFLNNPECLIDFLEHLIETSSKWSQLVYNTLVEHYLQVWSKLSEFTGKLHYEQKIIKILESPESNCDKHQVLILCQAVNFRPGLILLYEENKMYQQILQYHLTQKDYDSAIACCQRFGNQDSSLWVQALWAGARDRHIPPSILKEILYVIESKQLLSPLEVVDAVCSWNAVEIGDVRSYLNSVLRNELKTTDHEQALIQKYTQESSRIRKLIQELQNSPITFQGSRCSACNNQLELPSVHFLCQHSFHQHCFQSFADHENECPECLPNNKQILDVIKAQAQNRDLHETFHSQLERAEDGFSLVADYFGRGIFNKLTIISDAMRSKSFVTSKSALKNEVSSTQQGRNQQLQRPQSLVPKNMSAPAKESSAVQRPVNRVEQYSSTLEANLSHDQHTELTPTEDTRLADAINNKSKALSPIGRNPFEQDDDDDEQYPRTNNPFENDDDDDYDRNLNPFAS